MVSLPAWSVTTARNLYCPSSRLVAPQSQEAWKPGAVSSSSWVSVEMVNQVAGAFPTPYWNLTSFTPLPSSAACTVNVGLLKFTAASASPAGTAGAVIEPVGGTVSST